MDGNAQKCQKILTAESISETAEFDQREKMNQRKLSIFKQIFQKMV